VRWQVRVELEHGPRAGRAGPTSRRPRRRPSSSPPASTGRGWSL